MAIYKKSSKETLTPAKERWTPLYLDRGKINVDDSSVKWVGADAVVMRIPVATISALLIGPGTSITHAAVKACSETNTPICWVGQENMSFYSLGIKTNYDNKNARRHAKLYANRRSRLKIAKRMFSMRFPNEDINKKGIKELRGMEGWRIKKIYKSLSFEFGVPWEGRSYGKNNWDKSDRINKAISIANAGLYAFCTSIVTAMGFLPQLGFIHTSGSIPFVCDIADIYKHKVSFKAAFKGVSLDAKSFDDILSIMKEIIEEQEIQKKIPKDIQELLR